MRQTCWVKRDSAEWQRMWRHAQESDVAKLGMSEAHRMDKDTPEPLEYMGSEQRDDGLWEHCFRLCGTKIPLRVPACDGWKPGVEHMPLPANVHLEPRGGVA